MLVLAPTYNIPSFRQMVVLAHTYNIRSFMQMVVLAHMRTYKSFMQIFVLAHAKDPPEFQANVSAGSKRRFTIAVYDNSNSSNISNLLQ